MVVHPTEGNVLRWIIGKWWPLVRNTAALAAIYDYRGSKEGSALRAMQERRDGGGLVIFSGANSAASLSQVSVKRQLQDDLSWWRSLEEGDPEGLADDRSKAFMDAKIFKASTPNLEHDCRISEAWRRGTQENSTCLVHTVSSISRSNGKSSKPGSTPIPLISISFVLIAAG
jgi:phage terminase large subunit GpA-like protein